MFPMVVRAGSERPPRPHGGVWLGGVEAKLALALRQTDLARVRSPLPPRPDIEYAATELSGGLEWYENLGRRMEAASSGYGHSAGWRRRIMFRF